MGACFSWKVSAQVKSQWSGLDGMLRVNEHVDSYESHLLPRHFFRSITLFNSLFFSALQFLRSSERWIVVPILLSAQEKQEDKMVIEFSKSLL